MQPNKRRKPLKVDKAATPPITKTKPLRVRARKTLPPKPAKNKAGGKPNDIGWHEVFLKALSDAPNAAAAARASGIHIRTAYDHKDRFPDFKKAWQEAWDEGTDHLVGEAYRRSRHGTLKPVYQKGRKVGTIREYSDNLTIFLLKNHRPEVYGDKSKVVHSGNVALMTDEEALAAAAELESGLIATIRASAGLGKKAA
jgi:hypothetical protein